MSQNDNANVEPVAGASLNLREKLRRLATPSPAAKGVRRRTSNTSHNGLIILNMLQNTSEALTAKQIIKRIAQENDAARSEVRQTVLETLREGARFGYLYRTRGRYWAHPVDSLISEHLRNHTTYELDNYPRPAEAVARVNAQPNEQQQ